MLKAFIPKKIKVGFKNCNDLPHTRGKVIYFDEHNRLRNERGYETWRNKNIEPTVYDNTEFEGFQIIQEKNRFQWVYSTSEDYLVNILDPRKFIVTITADNLVSLITTCNIVDGVITDKLIYAWVDSSLCLIPVKSAVYAEASAYTAMQYQTVKKKELKPGYIYTNKQGDQLTYLDRGPEYKWNHIYNQGVSMTLEALKAPRYYFVQGKHIVKLGNLSTLSTPTNKLDPNYEKYLHSLNKKVFYSKISTPIFENFDIESIRDLSVVTEYGTTRCDFVFYTKIDNNGNAVTEYLVHSYGSPNYTISCNGNFNFATGQFVQDRYVKTNYNGKLEGAIEYIKKLGAIYKLKLILQNGMVVYPTPNNSYISIHNIGFDTTI